MKHSRTTLLLGREVRDTDDGLCRICATHRREPGSPLWCGVCARAAARAGIGTDITEAMVWAAQQSRRIREKVWRKSVLRALSDAEEYRRRLEWLRHYALAVAKTSGSVTARTQMQKINEYAAGTRTPTTDIY